MKIMLSKHIYRNNKTHELGCWAYKFIRIPYAPFVGLSIHDGNGEIMEAKIIQYDASRKETSCFVGSEIHDDYEHAKEVAIKWGWKVREVAEGNTGCENLDNLFLGL